MLPYAEDGLADTCGSRRSGSTVDRERCVRRRRSYLVSAFCVVVIACTWLALRDDDALTAPLICLFAGPHGESGAMNRDSRKAACKHDRDTTEDTLAP